MEEKKMKKKLSLVLVLMAVIGGIVFGQTAGDYVRRGMDFVNQREFDKAIQEFTRVIQLEPNNVQAYAWRGIAYRDKDNPDLDRAIADLTQALRLSPSKSIEESLAMAYNKRALVYFNNENFDKAIADYTEAIRLDPENRVTNEIKYNNRGLAYYYKGDLARAIADLEMAVRINPNNTTVRNNLEALRSVRR